MRELILTGHKDTWPVDEKKALFLGPHCFCYNDKYDFFEQSKFQIAPPPWKDAQDILDSSLYIDELYGRLIPEMACFMNSLYGLSYSEKFWNVYMILWLYQWLGIAYDRYRRLEHVGESIKEKFTVKILDEHNEHDHAAIDAQSPIVKFAYGPYSHYHNLVLMSDIIDHARFDFLDYRKVSVLPEAASVKKKFNLKSSLKDFLPSYREGIKNCLNNFFASSVFFGTVYGLSLKDKIYLQFLRDPALLFKKRLIAPVKVNKVTRDDLNTVRLDFRGKNRFERIVKEIILRHIPDAILMLDKYCAANYPNIKVWVGNDIYRSQKKCFEIASILERGGRWISSQHGGCYGQSLSFPIGKIEYDAAGEFITWGWKHKHIYNNAAFYALPSPMLSKLEKHKEREDSVILVSCMMPSYIYRLDNFIAPVPLINYARARLIFLEYLNKEILKKIKYKPFPYNFGVKETELAEKMLSKDQILTVGKLTNFFSRTRLAVIDHPGTSLLEALAMNTPTILYWDPAQFVFCEDARPSFKRLRDAGILFDNPEIAAKKINEIWVDVKGWWSDLNIQLAKNDFCFQFAHSQADWRNEWEQFVKNL